MASARAVKEVEERIKHIQGKELYERWNKLWVEQTGARDRPWDRMASEDPRESCMWEELATQLDEVEQMAKDEEAEGREMEEAEDGP